MSDDNESLSSLDNQENNLSDWLSSTPDKRTSSLSTVSQNEQRFSVPSSQQTSISQKSQTDSEKELPIRFSKAPELNRAFMKRRREDGKMECNCSGCGKPFINMTRSRLLKHLRKCNKQETSIKREILAVERVEGSNWQKQANLLWARVIVDNNISLRCVESDSMKNFVNFVCPDWKLDSRYTFSDKHIPTLSNAVTRRFMINISKNKSEAFLSVEFDHWQDANKIPLLGVVATLQDGARYLCDLINVSDCGHSSSAIVDGIDQALSSIDARAINSFTSDSASSCKKARELLLKNPKYYHIIQHRCVAHLLNRMGQHMTEKGYLKPYIKWAIEVAGFVSNSASLSAKFKLLNKPKVVKACPVRWYSLVNMLESLIGAKDILKDEAENIDDISKKALLLQEENWIVIVESLDTLKPLMECIGIAERKQGSLGEAIKSILEFGKILFTEDLDKPIINSAMIAFLTYFGPQKLGNEEFGLMLAAYVLDRRNNHDYVTQNGFDLALAAVAEVTVKSNIHASLDDIKQILVSEFNNFCNLEGYFTVKSKDNESALDWWTNLTSGGYLRQAARRISALRSSSANIERTFSSLKYLQGLNRLSFSLDTTIHMTRVRLMQCENEEDSLEFSDMIDSSSQQSEDSQPNENEVESVDGVGCNTGELEEQNVIVCQASSLPDTIRPNYLLFLRLIDYTKVHEERDFEIASQSAVKERIGEMVRIARAQREREKRAREGLSS